VQSAQIKQRTVDGKKANTSKPMEAREMEYDFTHDWLSG